MLKPWRIGPNRFLTGILCLGASGELLASWLTSEDPTSPYFKILLVSSLLLMWMTATWATWAVSRIITAPRMRAPARDVLHIFFRTALWLIAVAYAFCWLLRHQVHLFPDLRWFAFIRSGFAVIFYEVTRTSGGLLGGFAVAAAALLALIIMIPRRWLNNAWPDDQPRRAYHWYIFLIWITLAVTASMAWSQVIIQPRQAQMLSETTRFRTSVNPAITMAASLMESYEAISPDMDMAMLKPIVPDEELYASAAAPPASQRKSVLYLAVESLRGDVLFKEHQGQEITPNLNALAKRSQVFMNAYAQASHTDYSLPAYLSSQYPLRSQDHYYYTRDTPWPTTRIYDHLHNYGYRTAIISADTTNWGEMRNYLVSDKLDIFFDAENMPTTYSVTSANRGYVTEFRDTPRTRHLSLPDRRMVDFATAWIDNSIADGQPFFLHSFFYQPHYPYALEDTTPRPFQPSEMDFESTFLTFPPDKLDVMRNAYYNAVHETDAQIGRLVRFLEDRGELDNTIIAITGDHGEAFLEHGFSAHAGPLFQEVVHVPFIIFAPGIDPTTSDYPVQHIDMAPTVCHLLDVPPHPGFQGINVLAGDLPPLEDRYIYLTAEPPASWRGDVIIQGNRWKLWHDRFDDVWYLFNLEIDPGENVNIIDDFPDVAANLRQKLTLWRSAQLTYYTFSSYHKNYYPPKL